MTDQSNGAKLVDSVIVKLIARAVIIIGIPLAGWVALRAVNSVDTLSFKIDTMRDQAFDTNTTVKLIQQTQSEQSKIVADHEIRMRAVESLTRTLRN